MVSAEDPQRLLPLHQSEEVISHRLPIEEIIHTQEKVPVRETRHSRGGPRGKAGGNRGADGQAPQRGKPLLALWPTVPLSIFLFWFIFFFPEVSVVFFFFFQFAKVTTSSGSGSVTTNLSGPHPFFIFAQRWLSFFSYKPISLGDIVLCI